MHDRGTSQKCVTHKEDVMTGIIIELSNNRISESDQKEIVVLNPRERQPVLTKGLLPGYVMRFADYKNI